MGKCFHWIIGDLSNVFERQTSTGSFVFSLIMPWRHQICMAKCLYPYGDDLPKSLFNITAQEGKKVHFRLRCVAQKRRRLNCLVTHRSLTWLRQVQHGYQSPAERKPLKRNSAGTAKVVSRTEKSSKRDAFSTAPFGHKYYVTVLAWGLSLWCQSAKKHECKRFALVC